MPGFKYRMLHPTPQGRAPLLALAAAALLLVSAARQEQKNTSHVMVYAGLEDLTVKAPHLSEQGRYAEALDLYDQALKKAPHSVVPVERDDGGPRHLGISEFIRRQIAAWPTEGIEVYRERYDSLAAEAFRKAKDGADPDALIALRERHPFSAHGDDALALAANLLLQRGESARAARLLEQLIAESPQIPKPTLTARLAQAYALAGDRDKIRILSRIARERLPDARVRIGNEEVPLAAFLEDLEKKLPTRDGAVPRVDSWPLSWGGPSGTARAEEGMDRGDLAWTAPIPAPTFNAGGRRGLHRGFALPIASDNLPILPVVSDGIVYLHNEYVLYAYGLFGDRPELMWAHRQQPPSGSLMFDDRVAHTTSAWEGRVFAPLITSLGEMEVGMGYIPVKFPFPERTLHAWDAYDGTLLWKRGGRESGVEGDAGASFPIAPTPSDGLLYVGKVFQERPTDPFKHYVECLDAKTGRTIWSRFVASGHTEINLFGNPTRESQGSAVTVDDETLFYCTNLGAAAALDRRSGRVLWIRQYDQLPFLPSRSAHISRHSLGWANNAPLAVNGTVILTPADSPWLLALDARTGKTRWRLDRHRSNHRYIFGVAGDLLVLGGQVMEFLDLRDGSQKHLFVGRVSSGRGRGAVAPGTAYFPTQEGIYRVRTAEPHDADLVAWPMGRSGGNLVVLDGAIIVAPQERVDVYNDKRAVTDETLADLRRRPDDFSLRYRVALRYVQSGNLDEATRHLALVAAAADAVRPAERRLARAASRRLYTLSLGTGRKALADRELDLAEASLNRARKFAPDEAARTEIAFLLADVRIIREDYEGAVGLLNALLQGDSGETAEGTRRADRVMDTIELILRRAGRAVYGKFEAEAGALLEQACKGTDPAPFLEIVRRYPNSLSARKALLGAAEAHRAGGDHHLAATTLRRFLRDYPEDDAALEAHLQLVGVLEEKGSFGAAAALLRRMTRTFPDKSVEGTPVPEWVRSRLAREDYRKALAEAGEPRLSPPLERKFRYQDPEYPAGSPLVVDGVPPKGTRQMLLVNYGRAVKAIDLNMRAEAWKFKLDSPCRYAAYFDEGLLLCTDRAILRVDPATGAEEWRTAPGSTMRGFALAGHLLAYQTAEDDLGAAFVSAVEASDGKTAWKQPFFGIPATPLRTNGEHVFFAGDSPSRLYVFDLHTGRRLCDKQLPGAGGVQILYSAGDLAVTRIGERFIQAYRIPDGRLNWRAILYDITPEMTQIAPSGLFLTGSKPDGASGNGSVLMKIDLETGKIGRMREEVDIGEARFCRILGDRAVVLSRDPRSRNIVLRAFDMGTLEQKWSAEIGRPGATVLPLLPAGDHVVVPLFERDPAGKYFYSAVVFNMDGEAAQKIGSEPEFERPPWPSLANESLLFSVDNIVDIYH